MTTTTCTELFSFLTPKSDDFLNGLLFEEIYSLYSPVVVRDFHCVSGVWSKISESFGFISCTCDLCTIKRVTRAINQMERKVKQSIVIKGTVIRSVGIMDRDFVLTVLNASKIENKNLNIAMFELSKLQIKMANILLFSPFENFSEIEDLLEQSYLGCSPSIMKKLRSNFYLLQPRCLQINHLRQQRKDLLFGSNRCSEEYVNSRMSFKLPLVGIELNPGPQSALVAYLRNMETISDFTSTSTRSVKISKCLKSIERNQQKKNTKILNLQRRAKNARIFPEGLFDAQMGISSDTKTFLTHLVDNALTGLSAINVNHTVHIPLTDKFSLLIESVKKMGEKVWKIVLGLMRVFLEFINPAVAQVIRMFLGDEPEFYDACEVQPEMDVPWSTIAAVYHSQYFFNTVKLGNWEIFVKCLSDIKKKGSEMGSTTDILKRIVKEIGTFVYENFDVKIPFIYVEDILMQELQAEAKVLWTQYSTGQIDDYCFAERVSVFVNELENLLYEKRKTVSPEQKESLTYLLRKFQPVVQYCMRYVNPNNGPRVEPLAVLIGGPTGVGKSTITVPFLLSLMSRILPDDKKEAFMTNHNDFLFFRANENEFWDGYKMRNVAVVYDDFGQMKDAVGAPSADAFEIIRLKNTAPYHLHFAAIEDKQRNFATPKIIFATTNLEALRFNGITCSEAVARRFDLTYIQVPKQEFCLPAIDENLWSRRMDVESIRNRYPYDECDPSTFVHLGAVEYIPWNFNTGQRTDGDVLDFWQLLDLCEKKFQSVSQAGNRMLNFHKFMKSNPRPNPEMDVFNFSYVKEKYSTIVSALAQGKFQYESPMKLDSITKIALGSLGAVVGLSYGAYIVFSKTQSESSSSKVETKKRSDVKVSKTRARAIKRSNRAVIKTPGIISIQSGDAQLNAYLKVLKRNMYKLSSNGTDGDFGWAIFLFDRTFLIPRHFLLTLDSHLTGDDSKVLIVDFKNPMTGNVQIAVDWQNDVELYDYEEEKDTVKSDYVFMTIHEEKCRIHADITSMFVDEKVLRDGERFKAQMVVERTKNLMFLLPEIKIDNSSIPYTIGVLDEENQDISVCCRGLVYSAPTEKGDCGSILLTLDPRFKRPTILGIHTAGITNGSSFRTKTALGTYISQQYLMRLKTELNSSCLHEKVEVCDVSIEGFTALGKLEQPRNPEVSKITKSCLSGDLWETITVPANLKPFTNSEGKRLNPREIARMGYSHSEVYLESEILDYTHTLVTNLSLTKPQPAPWEPRVFSFEEATSGIPGIDYVDAINRSTSPGYPYVLERKGTGKHQWFGSEGVIDTNKEEYKTVRVNVLQMIEDAKNGIRNLNVFIDHLKDERRPKAKVDVGKTRQFNACGMDYLIAMKMYFGDFIRHICQNRIVNGVAVGINPYEEWEMLAKYLQNTSTKVMTAGDYSKYDARIPVAISYKVLDTIEQFYVHSTEQERRVRSVLWLEIVNSMHLSEGILYEFCGGNPSGQPLTAVFNSLANLEMLAYMGGCNFVEAGHHLGDFSQVFLRTRFTVFGDDNVIAHEPRDVYVFGQQVLEKNAMRLIGMEYTIESKDGTVASARKITEVSFLKRNFREEFGRYFCPLDLDVLHETLSWQRADCYEEELKLRIDCVLAELAHHGRQIFDRDAPIVARAARKHLDYTSQNVNFHIAVNSNVSLAIF